MSINIKRRRAFLLGIALIMVVLISVITSFPVTRTHTSNRTPNYTNNSLTMTFYFNAPSVSTKDLNGSQTISVDELPYLYSSGNPVLPYKPIKLLIPKGKQVKNVDISVGEKKTINNIKVKLSKNAQKIDKGNSDVTHIKSPYPESQISKATTQWKSSFQIMILNLYPVQYFGDKSKIEYVSWIKIDISLTDIPNQSSNHGFKPSDFDIEQIKLLVDNPDVIESYIYN